MLLILSFLLFYSFNRSLSCAPGPRPEVATTTLRPIDPSCVCDTDLPALNQSSYSDMFHIDGTSVVMPSSPFDKCTTRLIACGESTKYISFNGSEREDVSEIYKGPISLTCATRDGKKVWTYGNFTVNLFECTSADLSQ